MNTIQSIERENFLLNLHNNGIAELILKDNVIIRLEDSIEMEILLKKFNPENGRRILVLSPPGTNVTKESREYSNENPLDAKAMAIISKSLPQKIVVNFMMTIYRKLRPNYPVKMFIRKDEAVNWLLNQP